METLKQQALDYTLGVLPKDESLLFEAMLETDEDAQKLLIEAQEDCANLSMTANPKTLGNEVRSRVMEHCEPRMDFNPFLESVVLLVGWRCIQFQWWRIAEHPL